MKSGSQSFISNRLAIVALLGAGLGWGTTGLFVRVMGAYGLTVYELLLTRLTVAGLVLLPVLLLSLIRSPRSIRFRPAFALGFSMVLYYLGAIAAFRHLQLFVAALIIGTSPLLAWILPLVIERRGPTVTERAKVQGVALSLLGLAILISGRSTGTGTPIENPALGYLGAFTAAFVTVLNARYLHRLAKSAPKPLEVATATCALGILPCLLLISEPTHTVAVARDHVALVLGFGIVATAIPGLAIAFASVQLAPQATSTVSIQLQIWTAVLGWLVLGESLAIQQVIAGVLMIIGTWICVGPERTREKAAKESLGK